MRALSLLLGVLCYVQTSTAAVEDAHQGLYSHSITGGQLVVPRKVNHLGQHLSHDLTHHWADEDEEEAPLGLLGLANKRRRRRSAGETETAGLHYQLELNNETLHIELEPTHDSFIAPLMVVERHRRDTRTRRFYKDMSGDRGRKLNGTQCHYQGKVRGHPNSKVAISACNGLAGFLATKDGFYWIEPSRKHKMHPELGHTHVVFQGQNDGGASATKVPKKFLKKNRKHNNRRKRGFSTCGTREPKQPSETRIEWQKEGAVKVQGGRKTHRRGAGAARKRRRHRGPRSVSTPHHVEALLVADVSMVQFHQDVDVYLLTIMNMVSSLYKDPTIGNLVNVTVLRIVVLDEEGYVENDEGYDVLEDIEEAVEDTEENRLVVTHNAEKTLTNFCRWQRNYNSKSDSDPYHHDVAILITRKDICTSNGCSTLGVANVGGMCKPDRSCSLNEDNGITLAHTITHELGHNFGMYHDTEKTGCDHRIGPILHVMTPSFEADTTYVSWSNCSRRDITNFLDQGLGRCLDDEPTAAPIPYGYNDVPPGAMFKADEQCRFQFNSTDERVKVCAIESICRELWCTVNGECVSQLKAAAAGTYCGKRKWCQNNECVEVNSLPAPVDGGWGNWTEWSPCTRTCGSGISMQSRVCDNPQPANGGSFCVGKRIRYQACNTDPCPSDEPSFRAIQCSRFNNETFMGKTYTWLPYFDTEAPCKLFCTDTDEQVIVPWGKGAIDGTPCNIGTNDMCINGFCRRVGCDWIVDSNTTEDHCGICGGNGTSCEVVKGEFNEHLNITEGYFPIVRIPEGSRNIFVEEIANISKNFLSIGRPDSTKFYLNGNRSIYLPGEYKIAATLALYERHRDGVEVLKIPGPIQEDITLYVLMKGTRGLRHVGIRYEYILSSNQTVDPVFGWRLGEWTACSATCGGGVQHRLPICYQEAKGIVEDDLCWANAQNKRPTQITQACNEVECAYRWFKGPWQVCAQTCKKHGEPEPMKKRSVFCVHEIDLLVTEDKCDHLEQPESTAPCGQILPYCESDDDEEQDNRL